MNPKVTGIILVIIGLGVALYFFNSGAAGRVESLFTPPGGSSTSTIAPPQPASATTPTAATSSSGFSWSSFFSSLFKPHTFGTAPIVPGLGGGTGSQQPKYYSSGSGSGGGPGVTPPAGFTAAQLSPYYRKVRLNGVSTYEIGLSTYPAYGTPTSTVDITGWDIKTNHSGEYIPQAANIYYPTGATPESDIILALNQIQYVNIYSNSAPANLRVNACMGYLDSPQQFKPGFSYDCPAPDRSQIGQFTGACQNYILSLGSCQQPDFSSYYFPKTDYQCQEYLTGKYNYNWCLSTYASSPNFLSNEWRIWMGSSPLDPYHDSVELLDRNGLLVDIYTY